MHFILKHRFYDLSPGHNNAFLFTFYLQDKYKKAHYLHVEILKIEIFDPRSKHLPKTP